MVITMGRVKGGCALCTHTPERNMACCRWSSKLIKSDSIVTVREVFSSRNVLCAAASIRGSHSSGRTTTSKKEHLIVSGGKKRFTITRAHQIALSSASESG